MGTPYIYDISRLRVKRFYSPLLEILIQEGDRLLVYVRLSMFLNCSEISIGEGKITIFLLIDVSHIVLGLVCFRDNLR